MSSKSDLCELRVVHARRKDVGPRAGHNAVTIAVVLDLVIEASVVAALEGNRVVQLLGADHFTQYLCGTHVNIGGALCNSLK